MGEILPTCSSSLVLVKLQPQIEIILLELCAHLPQANQVINGLLQCVGLGDLQHNRDGQNNFNLNNNFI